MSRIKDEYVTIKAKVGSIVIVPKEIEAFKKHGIDLLVALKTIQNEDTSRRNRIRPKML